MHMYIVEQNKERQIQCQEMKEWGIERIRSCAVAAEESGDSGAET